MPRRDTARRDDASDDAETDTDDGTGTNAGGDFAAFGGSRLPIVGGLVLVGAVAGNLLVQALVAGGTLPEGTEAAMLPVLAAAALIGLVVLVGSILRR